MIFVRVPDDRLAGPGFLFEFEPENADDRLAVPLSRINEIKVDNAPVHFIFHSAFCRSTLLARAMNIRGVSAGLSEPGILAAIAADPRRLGSLITQILRLLARRRDSARAIFIKPTNHANGLIPALLAASPQSTAILMTNPLKPFLLSVRKRGLMGHRWGRRLYLELQGYTPIDFGMPPDEVFAMTDLQAAGLAWLLNQNYFTALAKGADRGRIRTLDGDYFNCHRGETISAVLKFAAAGEEFVVPEDLGTSDVFRQHSKLGGRVSNPVADKATAQEVAQVEQWLGLIGEQLRLQLPISQTLL